MLEMLTNAQSWVDVLTIIAIDLLLSGDNAIVIALACRNLSPEQRKKGIIYGVLGAIGLRVLLTFFALNLLTLPYLKLVGGMMLLWIGIKLILPEDTQHEDSIKAERYLWGAVKTIIIADFVMSLDNVLGVAAAAHGNPLLLFFGLAVSIPLIALSSQLILKLMDRFPLIIYAGGALLGYVAGEMLASDPLLQPMLDAWHSLDALIPPAGAILVVLLGMTLTALKPKPEAVIDLLDEQVPAHPHENNPDRR